MAEMLVPQMRRSEQSEGEIPLTSLFDASLSLVDLARSLVAQMNRRAEFLPDAVFEDPQWLMTLDLFIAAEEGREISVSSLCLASGVPSTTALRHIRSLENKGIFERTCHPRDRRISHLRLSATARRQVARYLRSLQSGPEIGERSLLRMAH